MSKHIALNDYSVGDLVLVNTTRTSFVNKAGFQNFTNTDGEVVVEGSIGIVLDVNDSVSEIQCLFRDHDGWINVGSQVEIVATQKSNKHG